MPKALRHFPNESINPPIFILNSANNLSIFYLPIFDVDLLIFAHRFCVKSLTRPADTTVPSASNSARLANRSRP